MALRISGHGDDLISVAGHVDDELDVSSNTILVGWPEPEQDRDAQGVCIVFRYAPAGHGATWVATVAQFDEGELIPWPVRIENAPASGFPNPQSYSVLVTVDCPDDVPVRVLGKGGVVARWSPDMQHRHFEREGEEE